MDDMSHMNRQTDTQTQTHTQTDRHKQTHTSATIRMYTCMHALDQLLGETLYNATVCGENFCNLAIFSAEVCLAMCSTTA